MSKKRGILVAYAHKSMTAKSVLALMCFLAPLLGTAASGPYRSHTLDVYGRLTGKSVLMPPGLPPLPDSIVADLPPDKTNAIASVESELSKLGIAVVQDGPHFVRVFPNTKAGHDVQTNAPLRGAQVYPKPGENTNGVDSFGIMVFATHEFLEFYGSLKQRTVLRGVQLTLPFPTLQTYSPLTTNELIYAMETLMALNGVAAVDDGPKFVQVVFMYRRALVRPHAPKPDPAAKLIDPQKVPVVEDQYHPTQQQAQIDRWEKAAYEFFNRKWQPFDQSSRQLVDLYAELADKTVKPSERDNWPCFFHMRTPLSKAELRYAIEATLAQNDLAIIDVDSNSIRLGLLRELQQPPGKQDANPQPKK